MGDETQIDKPKDTEIVETRPTSELISDGLMAFGVFLLWHFAEVVSSFWISTVGFYRGTFVVALVGIGCVIVSRIMRRKRNKATRGREKLHNSTVDQMADSDRKIREELLVSKGVPREAAKQFIEDPYTLEDETALAQKVDND